MPRTRASGLAGFLAVDKPSGWSSHDVVARVRKLSGIRSVGHAGTLDPFATGLLIVGIGKATRLIQYAQNTAKTYRATFRLGQETDTLDPEGAVVEQIEPQTWPDRSVIESTLASFIGAIEQVPPAHSAVHVEGKRAYELARAGQNVDLPARTVTIHSIVIERYEPPDLELTIRCGTGTYIRSLARDVGRKLGTFAYCSALRRTESGPYSIQQAVALDELSTENFRERWPEISLPPDSPVLTFAPVMLDETQTTAWYHGQSLRTGISGPDRNAGTVVRVYSASGDFAGLGRFEASDELRPELVFKVD